MTGAQLNVMVAQRHALQCHRVDARGIVNNMNEIHSQHDCEWAHSSRGGLYADHRLSARRAMDIEDTQPASQRAGRAGLWPEQ